MAQTMATGAEGAFCRSNTRASRLQKLLSSLSTVSNSARGICGCSRRGRAGQVLPPAGELGHVSRGGVSEPLADRQAQADAGDRVVEIFAGILVTVNRESARMS